MFRGLGLVTKTLR